MLRQGNARDRTVAVLPGLELSRALVLKAFGDFVSSATSGRFCCVWGRNWWQAKGNLDTWASALRSPAWKRAIVIADSTGDGVVHVRRGRARRLLSNDVAPAWPNFQQRKVAPLRRPNLISKEYALMRAAAPRWQIFRPVVQGTRKRRLTERPILLLDDVQWSPCLLESAAAVCGFFPGPF